MAKTYIWSDRISLYMDGIDIKKGDLPFKVDMRHGRRFKLIRVTVSADGKVTLSRPSYVSEKRALSFLNENLDWVVKRVSEAVSGLNPNLSVHSNEHFKEHIDRARGLVEEKVSYWNRFYGFKYNRIYIRNQKSRWGSCSSKGNLSFNYKIIFLKDDFQDYLVVHELCHLKYLNHSKDFWGLVSKTFPDYRSYRKNFLKSGGAA